MWNGGTVESDVYPVNIMAKIWMCRSESGLEATAVFLVEKEHFDKIRKKKEETKKRKAGKSVASGPIKRPHGAEGTTQATSTAQQVEESIKAEGSSDDSADECIGNKLEEMRVRYLELTNQPGKRKSTKCTLEPVMDNFINARTRGFPC